MPAPLRHPTHAHELRALVDRQIEASGKLVPTVLTTIRDWLASPSLDEAVFAERDRKANLPIPTPVGDLIPGSIVDLKADDGYGRKRTIKGATVGNNNGLTKLDPGTFAEVHLSRAGTSLRVKQRDISEIVVVRSATPIHGG